MNAPDRPFNRPEGAFGRFVFHVLDRIERRIRAASSVGCTPFFSVDLFPWVAELRGRWVEVLAEAETVMADRQHLPAFQEISEEVGYITRDRDWKTFMLVGYGLKSRRNLARCPATARALRRIPGLKTAFFSILEPGKRLPAHRGPYNGVLRLHLGLVVPEPPERCWIRVADERRCWAPGEVLIFDDSFDHEVHNDTAGVRVILFIDFVRPCRWPVSWLNRLVLLAARGSPLVRRASRNQRRWEQWYYASKHQEKHP
ncbi:MAG: aspartyl/asparaginyl beta-hydroxylase domain-containing protein [Steroidobacteraceae bacterium]